MEQYAQKKGEIGADSFSEYLHDNEIIIRQEANPTFASVIMAKKILILNARKPLIYKGFRINCGGGGRI